MQHFRGYCITSRRALCPPCFLIYRKNRQQEREASRRALVGMEEIFGSADRVDTEIFN